MIINYKLVYPSSGRATHTPILLNTLEVSQIQGRYSKLRKKCKPEMEFLGNHLIDKSVGKFHDSATFNGSKSYVCPVFSNSRCWCCRLLLVEPSGTQTNLDSAIPPSGEDVITINMPACPGANSVGGVLASRFN